MGPLLACEGDFGIILGPLFAYDDGFVATLGSLCVHFWHLRAALGTPWDHFGSTLGVTLGDVASHDGHFAMIVESLWVYKGPFSKNTHYPHRF